MIIKEDKIFDNNAVDYYNQTGIIKYKWHKWFAWHPVFLPESGWIWLKLIERQYSSKYHNGSGFTTWIKNYRLIDNDK